MMQASDEWMDFIGKIQQSFFIQNIMIPVKRLVFKHIGKQAEDPCSNYVLRGSF